MYCPKCGKELKEEAKFCTNCGYAVSGTLQDDVSHERSRRKAKWPIIIAVVILLILIAVVSFLAVSGVNRMRYQSFLKAGNRYLTEMNYEEAVVAFTKAIQIEEKEAAPYYGRGNAYVGLAGQTETEDDISSYYQQAEEDYLTALDRDETLTDAYEALSEVYLAQDEWDEALNILEFGYELTDEKKLSEQAQRVRDLLTAGNDDSGTDLGVNDIKEKTPVISDGEDFVEEEKPIILAVKSGNMMMKGSKPIRFEENGNIEPGEGNIEYVFNTDIPRNLIRKIEFLDHLDEKPSDAWDISEAQDGSVWIWFSSDSVYEKDDDERYNLYIAGEGGVDGNIDCSYLFYEYSNLESIEFNHCFYTGNVKDMSFMFKGCGALEELNLNCFDTSNVTNMEYMLSTGYIDKNGLDVSALKRLYLDSFDTSQVTNMRGMFVSSISLKKLNIGNFNTSQVTDMSAMFFSCQSLEELDLNHFDTSQVMDMSHMFRHCHSLKVLDFSGFDTSQVTNMSGMFFWCDSLKALDVSEFDTSQVTDMNCMFWGCHSLKDLDVSRFDTSQVTNMSEMFIGCSSLQKLDLSNFNTSQVVTMCSMFMNCESLEKLNIDNFDTSHVIDMQYMFCGCSSLRNLNFDVLNMANVSKDDHMFKGTQWE